MTTAMREPRQRALWDVVDTATFGHVRDMAVAHAPKRDVEEFCHRWHYAAHGGASTWNYGLYDGMTLVGICSYNIPTMPACAAVFGQERWEWVAHMGRLVCAEDAPRNSESKLIAGSLRLFRVDYPRVRAVLTYAAVSVGHVGYVYQATNALYCGTTAASHYYVDSRGRRRTPKQNEGPNKNGNLSQAKAVARGWTVHHEPGKHRYIYLLGNRTERREARALLQWQVLPYPKADGVLS